MSRFCAGPARRTFRHPLPHTHTQRTHPNLVARRFQRVGRAVARGAHDAARVFRVRVGGTDHEADGWEMETGSANAAICERMGEGRGAGRARAANQARGEPRRPIAPRFFFGPRLLNSTHRLALPRPTSESESESLLDESSDEDVVEPSEDESSDEDASDDDVEPSADSDPDAEVVVVSSSSSDEDEPPPQKRDLAASACGGEGGEGRRDACESTGCTGTHRWPQVTAPPGSRVAGRAWGSLWARTMVGVACGKGRAHVGGEREKNAGGGEEKSESDVEKTRNPAFLYLCFRGRPP